MGDASDVSVTLMGEGAIASSAPASKDEDVKMEVPSSANGPSSAAAEEDEQPPPPPVLLWLWATVIIVIRFDGYRCCGIDRSQCFCSRTRYFAVLFYVVGRGAISACNESVLAKITVRKGSAA